jgi:hypothetical protein
MFLLNSKLTQKNFDSICLVEITFELNFESVVNVLKNADCKYLFWLLIYVELNQKKLKNFCYLFYNYNVDPCENKNSIHTFFFELKIMYVDSM